MAALTPVISGLTTLTTAVGAANALVDTVQGFGENPASRREDNLQAQQALDLQQLQQKQQLDQQNLVQQTALERERIATDTKAAEERRQAALRRAVARQRASFGSQGIGSGGGSSQAVLLGLFDETEDELAQRERLDNIRGRALDLDVSQSNAINVLQRSQLAERQRLERELVDF